VDGRLAWFGLGLLLLGGVLVTVSRDEPRVIGVRVDYGADYDRVILELSAPAEIVRRPATQWRDLIVDLEAAPRARREELETESDRIGTLVLEEMPGGVRLSAMRRERRLHVFRLNAPPRLVVDFAERKGLSATAPAGALLVPTVALADPGFEFSAAASREAISPDAIDSLVDANPSGAGSAAPATFPVASPIGEESVAGGAVAVVEDGLRAVMPPAGTGMSVAQGRRAAWKRWLIGLPVAGLLLLILIAGVRRCCDAWGLLRTSPDPLEVLSKPEAEPLATSRTRDYSSVLARRYDEEVSARIQLEERVLRLQEEVRLLRDGLTRLARRSDPRP